MTPSEIVRAVVLLMAVAAVLTLCSGGRGELRIERGPGITGEVK